MTSEAGQRYIHSGSLALAALLVVGWGLLFWTTMNMSSPIAQLMMPMTSGWKPEEVVVVCLMWAFMMGAMMLPSAAPMIIVYGRVAARRNPQSKTLSLWFIFSYLCAWVLFSAATAAGQWAFQKADVLSRMLVLDNTTLGGAILIFAGLYQFTPMKTACLRNCRTPIGFLLTEWRDGSLGAVIMGGKHGAYCVGCCWALMALLFVFGVMNLAAIAILSTIVAVEKLAPGVDRLGQIGGLILVSWGLWMSFQ